MATQTEQGVLLCLLDPTAICPATEEFCLSPSNPQCSIILSWLSTTYSDLMLLLLWAVYLLLDIF